MTAVVTALFIAVVFSWVYLRSFLARFSWNHIRSCLLHSRCGTDRWPFFLPRCLPFDLRGVWGQLIISFFLLAAISSSLVFMHGSSRTGRSRRGPGTWNISTYHLIFRRQVAAESYIQFYVNDDIFVELKSFFRPVDCFPHFHVIMSCFFHIFEHCVKLIFWLDRSTNQG